MALALISTLLLPILAHASGSLRGTEVACSGKGNFGGEGTLSAPICYGGQLLLETFSIKVLSFDGKNGVVDMEAKGPESGVCIGAEFQTTENMVTFENQPSCLGGSEYSVRFCPDQNHFIVNVMKPVNAEVVLASQPCPEGEI